jgi:hypothetical protein
MDSALVPARLPALSAARATFTVPNANAVVELPTQIQTAKAIMTDVESSEPRNTPPRGVHLRAFIGLWTDCTHKHSRGSSFSSTTLKLTETSLALPNALRSFGNFKLSVTFRSVHVRLIPFRKTRGRVLWVVGLTRYS